MRSILRRSMFGVLALGALIVPIAARAATEVRIMWYSDGNEGEVVRDLLNRFETANPDIKVILDTVPYKTITENLPAQVASGQAPDMARVTDLGSQAQYYLDITPYIKDQAYWQAEFPNTLQWTRPAGKTDGIYGLMTQLTVTLPFVNESLFEQAGVAVPGPKATWQEWATAAAAVAKKVNAPIPIAIDRSGHRIFGMAISMGAKIWDGDKVALVDPGFKAMTQLIYDWHRDGVMAKQIWGSVGGTAYRGATEEFANGQVVVYVSGTWQIAQFAKTIGDGFDWHAVPSPCGPAACTGLPGGAALVAYKTTKHPAEVARIMDYLASEPVAREFYARTLFLPAHASMLKSGIDYQTKLPQVKESLQSGIAAIAALSPLAYRVQGYAQNRVLFNPTISRLNQAISGEMTLPDAWTRISSDVQDALQAQAVK